MTDIQDFAGRSVLVTGAASGIGKACAEALAERGASKLYLIDTDEAGLKALELGCDVHRTVGSVADPQLWEVLEPSLKTLDHVVANAGIGAAGPIPEISFAEWRRVMDVNLDGAFLTLAAAMRAMVRHGGSAVVVSSATGMKAIGGVGPYGVSKAAVAHMARIAALDGVADGIRVNAIAPGGVDTAIWESSEGFNALVSVQGREAALQKLASTTPSGRFASSAEIADTILYLLSDAASNITGQVLVSDGGFTL